MFTKHTHKNKSSFFRLKKQHLSLGYGKFKTIFDIEILKKNNNNELKTNRIRKLSDWTIIKFGMNFKIKKNYLKKSS